MKVSVFSILRLTELMRELGRSGSGGAPAALFTGQEMGQSVAAYSASQPTARTRTRGRDSLSSPPCSPSLRQKEKEHGEGFCFLLGKKWRQFPEPGK